MSLVYVDKYIKKTMKSTKDYIIIDIQPNLILEELILKFRVLYLYQKMLFLM